MIVHRRWILFLLTIQLPVSAEDNPRHIDPGPGITMVTTLQQNWSDEVSNWFYNVPQGSRLLPFGWFIHLEQADSRVPFRDPAHIRALGYIARMPDPLNPQGLPIGFIQDEPYEDGTAGLGVTCAACHTSQINCNGTAYIIDGGPALGDFERLLQELATALKATADRDDKFDRLADAVLPPGATPSDRAALRACLRTVAADRANYNERNLSRSAKYRFGPGRVDAFGAIFNEVSVTFLGMPANWRPANAPVSYPCLWDAPHHDRVQWNGAAENKVSPLGQFLFGTNEVGALGRNSGEVLGVFGNVDVNDHELLIPRRYSSTVNKAHLSKIEAELTTLWSPEWPQSVPSNIAMGNIDEAKRARGEAIYKDNCVACHAEIDRTAPNRNVEARLSDEGTDQSMIRNFGRQSTTGRLKGRRKTLLGLERFGETEATGVILKHVVERVILNSALKPSDIQGALVRAADVDDPSDMIDNFNPGYQMTATIEAGDQKLVGQFDSLVIKEGSVTVGGGRFHLMAKGRNVISEGLGRDVVDLRTSANVRLSAARLADLITAEAASDANETDEQAKARLSNATAKIGYKARPLNGVWATAPYLHNGSIPNLVELLRPAAQRVKTFHVGSREFDPDNVGFQDDANQPLFDTTVDGNTNTGHEFGTSLSNGERRDLLEYLKSL